ncbi:uncharacterized protein LOC111404597 [Olea europaea var. sylvestris]|uniref:uncharacterized protein LOC111404597 n=1 Tax=Olea europaea var. sylvestris TaxID=158386 RepID=UPI000C1D2B97|nr:uncharacterized protein LOC111404597 [Olea europaea var. sylvestris]
MIYLPLQEIYRSGFGCMSMAPGAGSAPAGSVGIFRTIGFSCASSPATDSSRAQELLNNTKKSWAQFNVHDHVSDLGIHSPIESYNLDIRDDIRIAYLEKDSCQPYGHDFLRRKMGNDNRCLRKEWFSEFYCLEYNIEKDAAYCLHCYIFKPNRKGQKSGHIFTKIGFKYWKHKKTLKDHGLSFRSHNESKESLNRGNLIELLNWNTAHCKEIKEILFSNAP